MFEKSTITEYVWAVESSYHLMLNRLFHHVGDELKLPELGVVTSIKNLYFAQPYVLQRSGWVARTPAQD